MDRLSRRLLDNSAQAARRAGQSLDRAMCSDRWPVRLIRRHRLLFWIALCAGLSVASFTGSFLIRFELSPLLQPYTSW